MEFIFLLKRSLLFWLEIWLAGARISSLKPLYSPEMDFTGHLRLTFFFNYFSVTWSEPLVDILLTMFLEAEQNFIFPSVANHFLLHKMLKPVADLAEKLYILSRPVKSLSSQLCFIDFLMTDGWSLTEIFPNVSCSWRVSQEGRSELLLLGKYKG